MNVYENIVIINAALSDEEINASISKIKDIIVNSDGEVLRTDMWGRMKLAYEINKHKKGYYVMLIYKTQPLTIKKLEEFYKVFDPVIKFMVIKLKPKQIRHLENVNASETEQSKSEV